MTSKMFGSFNYLIVGDEISPPDNRPDNRRPKERYNSTVRRKCRLFGCRGIRGLPLSAAVVCTALEGRTGADQDRAAESLAVVDPDRRC